MGLFSSVVAFSHCFVATPGLREMLRTHEPPGRLSFLIPEARTTAKSAVPNEPCLAATVNGCGYFVDILNYSAF